MKLSEFKELLRERWVLLRANTIFTAQRELAYSGNNWAGFLSTFMYTIAALIFIKVIYSNVQIVAGYSYNEMLLYFFVYQITYYTNALLSYNSLLDLIPDINNGNLDMILVKPVPSLYFVMTRSISVVSVITVAIPPILAIAFSIQWQTLIFSTQEIVVGLLVWIMGLIALHTIQFIATIPAFWFGESNNILELANGITSASNNMIPLQGYSQNLQKILGTVIPMLIATGFTASILLGKSNPIFLLIWSIIVAIVCLIIRNFAWKIALRHYTSASS